MEVSLDSEARQLAKTVLTAIDFTPQQINTARICAAMKRHGSCEIVKSHL